MSARGFTPKGSPAVRWWESLGIAEQDGVLHWILQNPPPEDWTEGPIAWAWTEGPFGWIARVARLAVDAWLTGSAPPFILQDNGLNIPRWWERLGPEQHERVTWWLLDRMDVLHHSPIAFAWSTIEWERIEIAPTTPSSPSPEDLPQVCSWCKHWIRRPREGERYERVSHGICDECARDLEEDHGLRRASTLEDST